MKTAFNICLVLVILTIITACGSKRNPTGGPLDIEKPVVTASVPELYGDISQGKIEISFSKALDKSTITQGVYIYPPITNKKVSYDANTITLRINEKLEPNTNYFVTLTTRLKDTRGNPLDKNQTIIFRNGILADNRLSGKIIYELDEDRNSSVLLNILSSDSLTVMSETLLGKAYVLDALNARPHILRAYIDKNQNGRYDIQAEPYYEGVVDMKRFTTHDINLAYQDTTLAVIRSARSISNRELEVIFSEPITSYNSLKIKRIADDFELETQIINHDRERLSIITAEMDTSRFAIELTNLKDAKANQNKLSRIEFAGSSRADQTPPVVTSTLPRNGTSVNDLQPVLEINFSEIIPAANIRYRLLAPDKKEEIPLRILQYNHKTYKFQPSSPLQNYRSYTLQILSDTQDVSGNKLDKDFDLTFLPLFRQ